MYGCKSWTIKKAEHWRIDVFELWCWRRLLRVPWTDGDPTSPFWRRSVLGIHWKDWCWSSISNTLATWCEELTHWKRPWCWEWLGTRGEGGDRGWDDWMASPTLIIISSMDMSLSKLRELTGRPGMLQSMGSQSGGHEWATELNWNLPLLQILHPLAFARKALVLVILSSCT